MMTFKVKKIILLVTTAVALSLFSPGMSQRTLAASGSDYAFGTIGSELFGAKITMSDTINTATTYSSNNVNGAIYIVSAKVYYYHQSQPTKIYSVSDSHTSSMNTGITISLPKTPVGARATRMEGTHRVNYISRYWATTTIVD